MWAAQVRFSSAELCCPLRASPLVCALRAAARSQFATGVLGLGKDLAGIVLHALSILCAYGMHTWRQMCS